MRRFALLSGLAPTILMLVVLGTGAAWAGSSVWKSVGPEGGSVVFVAYDPLNSSTIYATTSAGVFKSLDGGASWNNAGLLGNSVSALAIDPQDSNSLYAIAAGNLFKSADGAGTWNEVYSGQTPICMAIDPQNHGTVYIGGVNGVLKTTDGGATWQAASAGLPPGINSLAIDPQTPSTLYAAGFRLGASIFKSTDGGASWSNATANLPVANIFSAGLLTTDPKNPGTVYFTTRFNGVFKTKNGGSSWSAASSGLTPSGKPCCGSATLIDPQNSNTLFTANLASEIFRSADGGASWKILSQGPPPFWPLNALAIHPQDSSTLYAATGTGAFKSTDKGVTFSAAYSGMRAIGIGSFAIDPQTPTTLYAGTGPFGPSKSTDSGLGWFYGGSGINPGFFVAALAIDPQTPSNLYAGAVGGDCEENVAGGIFKSVDGSQSWQDSKLVTCLSALVLDPLTPSTIYGATSDRGVVKSMDAGASWTSANTGLRRGSVTALAIDPQTPGTLYAAVSSGTAGGLFKSTDGASTWNLSGLTAAQVTGSAYISALAIDPENTSTVYAATADSDGTSGALWKSADAGATWQNLLSSASNQVFAVIVNPQSSGTIYAATSTGVMTSADGGESWMPVAGSPNFATILTFDPQNPNTLYAGGGAGLFVITLGS
jgi:photosystem II stability/assembly factor-like uncharacterized protein